MYELYGLGYNVLYDCSVVDTPILYCVLSGVQEFEFEVVSSILNAELVHRSTKSRTHTGVKYKCHSERTCVVLERSRPSPPRVKEHTAWCVLWIHYTTKAKR